MYFSDSKFWTILKKDKKLFYSFYCYWLWQIAYRKITDKKLRPKRYAGRTVLSAEAGNEALKNAIKDGKSFMAGRFGSNELMFTQLAYFFEKGYAKNESLEKYKLHCENCGLFPLDKETIGKFGELMLESVSECDIMCVWYNVLEDYFCEKKLPKDSKLIHRSVLDFWNYDEPWTSALEGKKILVIHPFNELIEEQYKKRELLFGETNTLPEFELITQKAVQTIAGCRDQRFETWFDGLNYMYEQANKKDFDIAIVGCGAYGYPLAAMLKRSGKQVIHMGGVTQILFGIHGNRWNDEPKLKRFYNDMWVRPRKEDIPEKAEQVENSCYW